MIALVACLALAVGAALLVAARVDRIETRAVAPRHEYVRAEGWDGPSLRTVRFPSRDGTALAAWWLPPASDRVVLCTHGSGSTRASLLPVMRLLARHGYGVLALDWPGYGESAGSPDWGTGSLAAVGGALDWLAQSSPGGKMPAVVAGYGFSMGAYFLARAAPEEPSLRALVLEGVPTSVGDQLEHEYGRWGPLGLWPARRVLSRVGWRPGETDALTAVREVRPRPTLVIAGGADRTVPIEMAQRFAALGENVQLMEVPGAGHGACLEREPSRYESTLLRFLDDVLGER